MKVTFTGKQKDFLPAQKRKMDTRIAKIAKLVDNKKNEQEAHVVFTTERHLTQAEVTVAFYDHKVVSVASETDEFTALSEAFDKMEKQIRRLRTKWRDTKREPKEAWAEDEPEASVVSVAEVQDEEGAASKRVFRVDLHNKRKPMTLEEAILEMEKGRDHIEYFDSETDKLSVLVRRRDGNFDLIEE
jgi:putative sigma-54 modulation protein